MKSEDTTTAFTSKELLESASILSLYTLKVVLWGRMEGIHNTALSCKFLRMHFWPYCKDLASKLHTLEADETPWVKEDLSKMLPILYNFFWKSVTFIFHSEDSVFQQDSKPVGTLSALSLCCSTAVPKSPQKSKSF